MTLSREQAMEAALELAARGRGAAFPNPMVGAVILRDGAMVASGWHRGCGSPHAETCALAEAGGEAAGAEMFVNLEPCRHHGRTGPCVAEIIRAGISCVHVAMLDPDTRMRGGGVEELRSAGVRVEVGLLGDRASELNRAYVSFKETGRSFTRLKLAVSLDGRVAARDRSSRWITSPPAREEAGRMRAEADAIMVGAGTAVTDDPSLLPPEWCPRRPVRMVVSSDGRLPAGLKVFDGSAPALVAVPRGTRASIPASARLLEVPAMDGRPDLRALLEATAGEGMGEILCEGGSSLATSLLRQGLADRLCVLTAPLLIGGDGVAALGPLGVESVGEALRVEAVRRSFLGDDVLLEGRVVHRTG